MPQTRVFREDGGLELSAPATLARPNHSPGNVETEPGESPALMCGEAADSLDLPRRLRHTLVRGLPQGVAQQMGGDESEWNDFQI